MSNDCLLEEVELRFVKCLFPKKNWVRIFLLKTVIVESICGCLSEWVGTNESPLDKADIVELSRVLDDRLVIASLWKAILCRCNNCLLFIIGKGLEQLLSFVKRQVLVRGILIFLVRGLVSVWVCSVCISTGVEEDCIEDPNVSRGS